MIVLLFDEGTSSDWPTVRSSWLPLSSRAGLVRRSSRDHRLRLSRFQTWLWTLTSHLKTPPDFANFSLMLSKLGSDPLLYSHRQCRKQTGRFEESTTRSLSSRRSLCTRDLEEIPTVSVSFRSRSFQHSSHRKNSSNNGR